MKDEIIAELWRIKDELARESNYDVHVLCRNLREQQKNSGAEIIDRSVHLTEVDVVCQESRHNR